jgi:signal transduction histidine kinase
MQNAVGDHSDRVHSNAIEGCGLGLSIAQWIAQAHGGAIDIASELGKLTRVAVRLAAVPETTRAASVPSRASCA